MNRLSKKAIREFKVLLKKNLYNQIVYAAGPHFIDLIMDEYEKQLEGIAPEDDPTAPEHLKEQFKELLITTIRVETKWEGDKLYWEIARPEDLGYGSPPTKTSTDLLKTFMFILEGIMGEYAWIGQEFYEERKKNFPQSTERREGQRYGRLGHGYLISKERWYSKERWDKFGSFEEFRWGFSNQGPKPIFDDAERKMSWGIYIEKAIDDTVKQMRSKGYGTKR
jgi:hypothetical protein